VAQGGWKNPANVTATISEKFADAPARELTIFKKGDSFSFITSSEIDGMLGGTKRVEIAGPTGFYTWLPEKPDIVLRLWNPSSFDIFDYLAKPKFSRADLEVYLEGIEKALGKKVLVGKQEAIAERDCLQLTILDRPGSSSDYQRLWIDRETGLAMKLLDVTNGKTDYEREIKSISFAVAPPEVLFMPKEGAKVLSGIVMPTTLVNAANLSNQAAFEKDISDVNQKSGNAWAGASDDLLSFGYAGSNFRQIRRDTFRAGTAPVDPREEARNRRRQARGNQLAERARFITRNSSEGQQTFEIRIAAAEENPAGGMIFTTTGSVLPDSDVNSPTNGGRNANDTTVVYPMVQSDFVDPKTGATLTLLQIEKRDLKPWLAQLGLGEGEPVPNEGVGNAKFFTVDRPVKVNVLTWQAGQAHLALVSTNLAKEQLVDLAGKIRAR
jgi:hypothetical protein